VARSQTTSQDPQAIEQRLRELEAQLHGRDELTRERDRLQRALQELRRP
jgi:hypothetical protein